LAKPVMGEYYKVNEAGPNVYALTFSFNSGRKELIVI
jgi:hypothetical protein